MIFSRPTTCTLVFIFCCLPSSIQLVMNAPAPSRLRESADEISKRSDLRFAAIKTMLPSHGVVGYVGEAGDSGAAAYYLTQYALAPLVVEYSPHHALVVGNFPKSQRPVLPDDLKLVQDFGGGVLLFAAKDAH